MSGVHPVCGTTLPGHSAPTSIIYYQPVMGQLECVGVHVALFLGGSPFK